MQVCTPIGTLDRAYLTLIFAVIIKGTQVYDSAKGSFTDLSVLDVLQVFGRAGCPGLESSGVGFICTTEDKLQHYLDAVTSQVREHFPISPALLRYPGRIRSNLGKVCDNRFCAILMRPIDL